MAATEPLTVRRLLEFLLSEFKDDLVLGEIHDVINPNPRLDYIVKMEGPSWSNSDSTGILGEIAFRDGEYDERALFLYRTKYSL